MPESLPPPGGQPRKYEIIQPCGEACACFQRLPRGYEWTDFGICENPRSKYFGSPVRIGRECRNYQTDPFRRWRKT